MGQGTALKAACRHFRRTADISALSTIELENLQGLRGGCRSTEVQQGAATVAAAHSRDATLSPRSSSVRDGVAAHPPCAASASPPPSVGTPSLGRSLLAPGAASAAGARNGLCPAAASRAPFFSRGFAAASGGWQGGRGGAGPEAAEVVEQQEAARRVMADPMSRLMASQGMPVGLSLKGGDGASGGGAAGGRDADDHAEDLSRPPRPEPAYNMEAFSDMLRATASSARRGDAAGGAAGGAGGAGEFIGGDFTAGVQSLGASQLDDSWGTTRESPADIARRIAESNDDGAGSLSDGEEEDDGPEGGVLSPSEQKYASLEAMSADIKKLDEVFEVLASVPWLDDDVLAERELKGVAQVGLLGTLEEVGFNIRPQLLRIWAGERGAELAAGPGLEFRDQAALLAILYHTQQIEEAHGAPAGGYPAAPPGQQQA